MNELLTTTEAAESLGVSVRRVRQLINEGKLDARQVGRDYVIAASALESVKVYGKAGRPPKSATDAEKPATGQMRATNGAATGKKRGGKAAGGSPVETTRKLNKAFRKATEKR